MQETLMHYGMGLSIVGILLLLGKLIRVHTPILYKLYLPSCIIAGFLALLLGPEVLGKIIGGGSTGLFPSEVLQARSTLPAVLINVVFAGLFLGKRIPNIKKIRHIAGPQFSFAQVVAWGQYVLGILLAVIILGPLFGLPPMAGALIEVAFEGGHGTAAGLTTAFQELGFEEGLDLAIGLATIGVFGGIIGGIILVNRGIKKNKTTIIQKQDDIPELDLKGLVANQTLKKAVGYATTRSESIEPLTVHLAFIGIAVMLGYGLWELLVWGEGIVFGGSVDIMRFIPIFPLAMVGGVILQIFLHKFLRYEIIDRQMIISICGTAMDVLIVTALAGLSLTVIGNNLIPFILLAAVGITRNVLAFVYIAPKMMREYRFEKGISDYGQATGMTVIGLLLVKMTDPENEGPGLTSFGYKQLLFEPFLGGGLFTAASIPLIAQFGRFPILILATILMIIFFVFGYYKFGVGATH